jgi:hypothetical protein
MANVVIDIATEFTGKKAFKQAETSVDKLNATTKNLGKTLTRTLGAAAIVAFGRASVKAFAEDDKAAASLGQTLKNLNLAYGSNIGTVNGYINRLEAQTGVLDDELRPAMDRLLRATGSVTKSQELLSLALDIAAGTGKTVTQVSQSLQKAFLGQTQALGRLGVGLSKAELASGSFEEIQQKLTTLFAGQAVTAADTFAGRLDKLTIAANNAKETIGKGLYDAVTALGGGGATAATDNIDKLSTGIADSLKNAGEFVARLEKLKPVLIAFGLVAAAAFLPVTTAIAGVIFLLGDLNKRLNEQSFRKGIIPNGMGNVSMTGGTNQDTQKADALAAKKAAAEQLKLLKAQAAAASKIAKDKRLALLIDKASLALNKGNEVFDLDKIQIAAALANQAEQLGKATSSAQLLQIANDTARLNVKRSINELEDAIAAKDEAAIIAATKRLDADLKVLDALTGQNTKMTDIKSILEGLKPKELIDQKNLDEALRKIREMLAELANFKLPTSASLGSGIPANDYIAPIPMSVGLGASTAALIEASEAIQARADAFSTLLDMQTEADTAALAASPLASSVMPANFNLEDVARSSLLAGLAGGAGVSGAVSGSRYAAQAANAYNITINAGVGSDPNAIAEALTEVVRDAINRGTLVGGVFEA